TQWLCAIRLVANCGGIGGFGAAYRRLLKLRHAVCQCAPPAPYWRSRRSLIDTTSASSTTSDIRPNPTATAVDQDLTASTENVAAVITAIPTAVPIRWPVCMMAPELPA